MKILFLPNWDVRRLKEDTDTIQSPDKQVEELPYWFFRYFPEDTKVDIIDRQKNNILHPLEVKLKFYIRQAIQAFRIDKQYDAVISHGAQSGLVYSLLRTLTKRKYPKHIIIDVGGMNGAKNNKIENRLIAFALKSNPYIICHSNIIIENYKQTCPNLLARTVFIPFGINPEEFDEKNIVSDKPYIFSFGTRKRDYDTLFAAWKSVKKESITLKIAGISDYPLVEPDGSIELLGHISIDNLKDLIRKSLFVVIPLPVFNYSYGQMSFLQSMCLGKTVIVTQTPSSVDYIEDGNGAFFVKPYDVADLKSKIEILLSDRQLLEDNNRKAREYILSNFTEEKMGKQFYEFLNNRI